MKYNNKVIIPFITFFVVFSVLVCLFSLNVYGNNSEKSISTVKNQDISVCSSSNDVLCISFNNFYSEMNKIWNSPEDYNGYTVNIEGYFTKMENEDSTGLYYFLADDLCMGCEGVDMRGHFVELSNSSSLNLDEIWSDDFVRIHGIISVNTFNNLSYPIIEMTSVEMLEQGFER